MVDVQVQVSGFRFHENSMKMISVQPGPFSTSDQSEFSTGGDGVEMEDPQSSPWGY